MSKSMADAFKLIHEGEEKAKETVELMRKGIDVKVTKDLCPYEDQYSRFWFGTGYMKVINEFIERSGE